MITFTHPACLLHDPGQGHPEASARLRAVLTRIEAEWPGCMRSAAFAPRSALLRVHTPAYLEMLEAVSQGGGGILDEDTFMSAASWDAARGGAGAVLACVGHALETGEHAFAAVRPPGHHALAGQAMGFCLVANAVIAAREAQARGVERVLIVDWDVHHGNGTQALVETDPSIRFISLHLSPHWPGTGRPSERGVGNVTNLPMPAGLPPERYVEALDGAARMVCEGWTPGLILISAGYDSMRGDPLGGFTLEPEHYAEIVRRLRGICPAAPLVAMLEGGYVPARIADGVVATLRALDRR